MVTKKAVKKTAKKAAPKRAAAKDVPNMFRLNIEVGDLDQAAESYGELFGLEGRKQAGSRVYFTCGPVTLQVVDVSSTSKPHALPKALYFTVRDLEAVHARASELGWLSKEKVHGERGGEIVMRPWGERSFYVDDPWNNQFCFVEEGTIYPG